MIAIVDYGMGNLRSVFNALEIVGGNPRIVSNPDDLDKAERIVLPGVGAFGDCINNLCRTGFKDALEKAVLTRGLPILGICLGMQVMAMQGSEFGDHEGLGWFSAKVARINPTNPALSVPHVGWNDINYSHHPMFAGLPTRPDFYFVHSFHMHCTDQEHIVATCDYGEQVTAAVAKENIFATQFHPEKSHDYGLRMLKNFLEWKP